VLRVKVLVEAALAVVLPEEVEELAVAPVMWNGKEYWKMVGSESRLMVNPKVANEPISDGMDQLNFPAEFSIPALMTGPVVRVDGEAPSSNVMVTVPV